MNLILARAVIIGVLGGVAAWLFIGPLAGLGLQIWAALIAMGCFFQCGGREDGLKNTITNTVWGALCAIVAVLLAASMAGGNSFVTGIIIAVTLAIMVLGSQIPLVSVISAALYGYAATLGHALLGSPDPLGIGGLGPFLYVIVSMAIGAGLGYASEKLADMLVGSKAAAA